MGHRQRRAAREISAKLIHCRISGFGGDGPRMAAHPGYDAIIQSMVGLMAATGSQQSGPTRIGVRARRYGDRALCLRRHPNGVGGACSDQVSGNFVEATLYETGLAIMHPHTANYFMHGKPPALTGNEHPNLVPVCGVRGARRTISSWASAMTARSASCAKRTWQAGARHRYALSPATSDRIANRDDALRENSKPIRVQITYEARTALSAACLRRACQPVQCSRSTRRLSSPHTIHRGDVDRPRDWYKGVASPSAASTGPRRACVARSAEIQRTCTSEILGEFGYSKSEIEALVAKGSVCRSERKLLMFRGPGLVRNCALGAGTTERTSPCPWPI